MNVIARILGVIAGGLLAAYFLGRERVNVPDLDSTPAITELGIGDYAVEFKP